MNLFGVVKIRKKRHNFLVKSKERVDEFNNIISAGR